MLDGVSMKRSNDPFQKEVEIVQVSPDLSRRITVDDVPGYYVLFSEKKLRFFFHSTVYI